MMYYLTAAFIAGFIVGTIVMNEKYLKPVANSDER